jgi:two-component system CheB/CheR fusion protein
MPPDPGSACVIVQHLPPDLESLLVEILSRKTAMTVRPIEDQMPVEPNCVYVIRPGHTPWIEHGRLHLGERLTKPMNSRPIDDFFKSLANEQRERAIAIILSGMGSNGSAGAQAIKAVGGLCIAQDPESAQFPSMPRHLIDAGYADYILPPADMPEAILAYAGHPYASGAREREDLARREQQNLREVLALLRTRTRQDFNGYKKPTVYRRIQRRMGLNRMTELVEYARFLRQSPSEVTALADDLLIHVTGFFRDPDAWETLRRRVIVPLIASRDQGSAVRAWVTACSSGEEAYTLAMLLVEEAERINKPLDIKVFATDMAERTLANARQGSYPGGIESEIEPQRLERFFLHEDAIYRVRQELRERVVFAPQNVLQDPPFSRLDIVSCRNLLIYLEPDVQKRVLSLLHFGLREGGALFLGTSETTGAEAFFEPVDKKARIFRRVGPTRHGSTDFPLPRALIDDPQRNVLRAASESRPAPRPTIAQLTTRALLQTHTPPAVTIDRDFHIVYYHGNTQPFLTPPRGEPTRDLMSLARDSLRGAIRSAVHRAISENAPVTVTEAWIEKAPGQQVRVAVNVSPLEAKAPSNHYVVSFQERGDLHFVEVEPAAGSPEAANGGITMNSELVRVRDELQSTVEELQTSNEELKASHEELVSTNEELQSANEELETSREEMQSLNEELSTVNSQLHAKMEEHQAARNDLASLLTSTDIAVVFLDTRLRIRRYTPAVCELFDLIGTDVGRPLADLHRKFDDPTLNDDVRDVLNRLVPAERDVTAANGRRYLRRALPYRTDDNRIEGIVITFHNVTKTKLAEDALRASEEQLRTLVDSISDYAIIMLDADGRISMWNPGAHHLLGYTEKEALGALGDIIFTPEDRAAGAPDAEKSQAAASGRATDERWHVRKNGTRFWGSGIMNALRHADGSLRGFVKIMRDETARKQTEDSLQGSKVAAEEANRLKDDFLATLSHELRTPLGAILLWTKLIQDDAVSDPQLVTEAVNAIHTSAQAQQELIEDLLDVSRIANGTLRLQVREVDLVRVIRDAVEAIEPAVQAKQLTVAADLSSDIGIVRVDSNRLRQIIWNLLTNAVKFTPAGGKIHVHLRRDNREVEIAVQDTGEGIDPTFLPHVLERFRQANSSHARSHGGMGLGLAIVKQLVELHGGTITVESPGVDKGATFTVRLPLPRLAKSDPARTSNDDPTSTRPAPDPRAARIPDEFHGMTTLLVEDDDETRHALSTLLRQAGMQVIQVATADAALKHFTSTRPTIVISDIGLPGLDGHQMMRQLRAIETRVENSANPSAPPVPAIALTAYAGDADRQASISAGYQRHVGKPVDPAILIDVIRELLQNR